MNKYMHTYIHTYIHTLTLGNFPIRKDKTSSLLRLHFLTVLVVSIFLGFFLCRGWFQDVPRRGLASAVSAVNRQHYTGCVDNGTTI